MKTRHNIEQQQQEQQKTHIKLKANEVKCAFTEYSATKQLT